MTRRTRVQRFIQRRRDAMEAPTPMTDTVTEPLGGPRSDMPMGDKPMMGDTAQEDEDEPKVDEEEENADTPKEGRDSEKKKDARRADRYRAAMGRMRR